MRCLDPHSLDLVLAVFVNAPNLQVSKDNDRCLLKYKFMICSVVAYYVVSFIFEPFHVISYNVAFKQE